VRTALFRIGQLCLTAGTWEVCSVDGQGPGYGLRCVSAALGRPFANPRHVRKMVAASRKLIRPAPIRNQLV